MVTRPKLGDFIPTKEEMDWRAQEIFALVKEGKLKFQIGGVYTMESVGKCHDDIEGGKTTGKLLLEV